MHCDVFALLGATKHNDFSTFISQSFFAVAVAVCCFLSYLHTLYHIWHIYYIILHLHFLANSILCITIRAYPCVVCFISIPFLSISFSLSCVANNFFSLALTPFSIKFDAKVKMKKKLWLIMTPARLFDEKSVIRTKYANDGPIEMVFVICKIVRLKAWKANQIPKKKLIFFFNHFFPSWISSRWINIHRIFIISVEKSMI